MDKTDFKKKFLSLSWKRWLERPFDLFVSSLFVGGTKKETFEKLGIDDLSVRAILNQNGVWYESAEVWDDMKARSLVYMQNHKMNEVSSILEDFYSKSKIRLKELSSSSISSLEKLQEFNDIFTNSTMFVWLTHGIEEYYNDELTREVPKYVSSDIDAFIGDASFPSKKNAHSLMEEMMREGISSSEIAKRYTWLKCRDGFCDGFNESEIDSMREGLKEEEEVPSVNVPLELQDLFDEVRELVYFRTARTDVFYHLLYLARPILKEVASHYGLSFQELKHYTVQDLLLGDLKQYGPEFSLAAYEGEMFVFSKRIVEEKKINSANFVKGKVAYKGKVIGRVKIVKLVSEIYKVEKGDVLVTQMTFPSFLPAMIRACAFVTDEGGITCHAAIVAREMKKPCVIGTKTATRLFKDEDLVEVDAVNGIVRKVSEN
jgi:phosphohistidine swiveling domain-containing protein